MSPSVGLRTGSADLGAATAPVTIVRDFADPHLEMVRLLREAAEVEHALMVQYLYAAFSVKGSEYPRVLGLPSAGATSLLGVAIQEMEHLHTVNQMLVAIGAAPGLVSQEFPYEPQIFPFPLHLEPLSQRALAKYVFAEAPKSALDRDDPANAGESGFLDLLFDLLDDLRPNQLGSLYGVLLKLCEEISQQAMTDLPDLQPWMVKLEQIKEEGEGDHFRFFKELFLGVHQGFKGRPVWTLSTEDPQYPAFPILVDPSAYEGHPLQIPDDAVRRVAFLGDVQYWIVLMLLDLSYRQPDVAAYVTQAKKHMRFPMKELGIHLASLGAGLPFDPLGMGYSPGVDRAGTLRLLRHLLGESQRLTVELRASLPETYSSTTDDETLTALPS
ncbi:MAG: ferritin-like domain-containing protein [Acidimicrobiales bacterium]